MESAVSMESAWNWEVTLGMGWQLESWSSQLLTGPRYRATPKTTGFVWNELGTYQKRWSKLEFPLNDTQTKAVIHQKTTVSHHPIAPWGCSWERQLAGPSGSSRMVSMVGQMSKKCFVCHGHVKCLILQRFAECPSFLTHRCCYIYGNIYHQYTPMLAYIPYMDPMGYVFQKLKSLKGPFGEQSRFLLMWTCGR